MFYRPWKVEEGVVAVPFEVVWNRLVGFCWVVQLSGWLRFSCWTSSRSLEDDRACVARRFLDEMRWAGSCNSPPWRVGWEERRWEAQLDSLLRCRRKAEQPLALGEVQEEPVCSSPGDGWRKRTGPLPFSSERVCGESGVEKERVKRGRTCLILAQWPHRSWGSGWPMVAETCVSCWFSHLCVMLMLLGNWVPLLSRTPNSTCGSRACTWRPNFVHQKPCPNSGVKNFCKHTGDSWSAVKVCHRLFQQNKWKRS